MMKLIMKKIHLVYILILISHVIELVDCDDYAVDLDVENSLDEMNNSDNDEFTEPNNVTILWKEFGFRMVCDKDEWQDQFNSIKSQMIECLEVNDIVYETSDEQEFDRQRKLASFSGKTTESPYCWLAKNWKRCLRLMAGLECIEPNPKSLSVNSLNPYIKKLSASYNYDYDSSDPYDWRNMIKPYTILCEMVKLQAKSNIFETLGAWL